MSSWAEMHVDLALHVDEHAAQPVFDRERLEQRLLVGDGNVEVSGDEVRQAAGLVDFREDLVDGLVGQAELLAELGGALARLAVEAGERRVARRAAASPARRWTVASR